MKITMAHGSGGRATSQLIADIFARNFNNEVLSRMEIPPWFREAGELR